MRRFLLAVNFFVGGGREHFRKAAYQELLTATQPSHREKLNPLTRAGEPVR